MLWATSQLIWAETWDPSYLFWSYFLVTLEWNMTHIKGPLRFFPATLSWNMIHIILVRNYFPATLAWNMTIIVAVLTYFLATPSWSMTKIVAALKHFPGTSLKHDIHCSSFELLHTYCLFWGTTQLFFFWRNMTPIAAALSFFRATLCWNITHIIAVLKFFLATLTWNMTRIAAVLKFFPATLSWCMAHIEIATTLRFKLLCSSFLLWGTF